MRTYEMKDGVLTCIVDSQNFSGSLVYDFMDGELVAHKPENISNLRWIYYIFGFLKICRHMVRNIPQDAELK